MYCPQCHHPLLGDPDVCPNCGYILKTEETPQPDTPQAQVPAIGEKLPLNRKVFWSSLFLFVPVGGILLFQLLSVLFGGVSAIATIAGIMIFLFILLAVFLVPTSIIVSLLGLKAVKRSGGTQSGKGLAWSVAIMSSVIILGAAIAVIILIANFDLDSFMEKAVDNLKPETVLELAKGMIEEVEKKNRKDDIKNSFGTYFPENLDKAEPGSLSGPDNPFFSKLVPPSGWRFKGWKKGDDINTYILLSDSSVYLYEPRDGSFAHR